MNILGIDIGGSGIKGAVVDTGSGQMLTDRHRLPTPQPSKPKPVCKAVSEVVRHFEWTGPIGCTFPAIVHHGSIFSAANVNQAWIGKDAQKLLSEATGLPTLLMNDADAAGLAEIRFGAGRGEPGLVIMITLGTGIGSALFYRGLLIPNAELGHLEIRGRDAEERAAARVHDEKGIGWGRYAKRVNEYLGRVEFLFSPDLFIIGGGISKEHDKFLPKLKLRTRVVPAELFNDAGIIGAAIAAAEVEQGRSAPE